MPEFNDDDFEKELEAMRFAANQNQSLGKKAFAPVSIITAAMAAGAINLGAHFYIADKINDQYLDLDCLSQPHTQQDACFDKQKEHNDPLFIQKVEKLSDGAKISLGIMLGGIVVAFGLRATVGRKYEQELRKSEQAYKERGSQFRSRKKSEITVIDNNNDDKPSRDM